MRSARRSTPHELTGADRELPPGRASGSYRPLHWQVLSTVIAAGLHSRRDRQLQPCANVFPAKPTTRSSCTPRFWSDARPRAATGLHAALRRPATSRSRSTTGRGATRRRSDFLSVLERLPLPATFFEIGEQISTYDPRGTVERQMLADGDMIGDHTWTHPDMAGLSPAEQRRRSAQTVDAIQRRPGSGRACSGRPTERSPRCSTLARSLGFLTISRTSTPRLGAARLDVITSVLRTPTTAGSSCSTSAAAPGRRRSRRYPTRSTRLRAQGYHFVTLTQMLGLQAVSISRRSEGVVTLPASASGSARSARATAFRTSPR